MFSETRKNKLFDEATLSHRLLDELANVFIHGIMLPSSVKLLFSTKFGKFNVFMSTTN